MPKKADSGAANMKAVLANQSSLANLTDDQLAAIGGSRDPIDSEDFSDADFGNDITESPSDEADDDADTEADDKGDDADEEKDDADSDEDDPEKGQDDEDDPEKGQDKGDDDADDADDKGDGDDDDGADQVSDDDGDADDDAGDEGESGDDDADAGDDAEDQDDDEEDDEPAGKKDQRVPLERFREVNRKMREMQRELQELKSERAAEKGHDVDDETKPYDFDAAEERYQDLVLDGKKSEAAALRKEIRAAERAEFQKDADVTAGRHAEASHSKRALDKLAAQYERDYPAMNEQHDDYDPEVNLEVEAAMLGYLQQNYAPEVAFKKALDKTVRLFNLKPAAAAGKPGKSKEGGDEGKGKGKAKGKQPDPVKQKQKAAAGKDKAKKAKSAPPDTTKVGDAGDRGGTKGGEIDIENMSEEEFNALPKSVLARLRGDVL